MGDVISLEVKKPEVVCASCNKELEFDVEKCSDYDSSEMCLLVSPCKECSEKKLMKKLEKKNAKLAKEYGFKLNIGEE